MASGQWTYGGLATALIGVAQSSPLVILIGWLSSVTTPLAAVIAGGMLRSTARKARLASNPVFIANILAIIVGMGWHFIAGRRALAIITIEVVIALVVFSRKKLVRKLKISSLIYAFAGLSAVIAFAWPAFFAIRAASYSFETSGSMPSIIEMLESSATIDQGQIADGLSDNIASRTSIIDHYSMIQNSMSEYILGSGIVYNIASSLPPFIFIGKQEYMALYPTTEAVWTAKAGVPFNDWANTIALESYVDFGILGLSLYLVLTVFVVKIVIKLCNGSKMANWILFLGLIYTILNIESSYNGLIVTLRNAICLIAALYILDRVLVAMLPARKYAAAPTTRGRPTPVVIPRDDL